MSGVILIVIGIVEALIFFGVLFAITAQSKASMTGFIDSLRQQVDVRQDLSTKIETIYAGMVPLNDLITSVTEVKTLQESLKAERGRITITQAELETVESRLRELDEIERELEASGLETKEELNILQKKQKDLTNKNEQLKQQLTTARQQINEVSSQIQLEAEMKTQIEEMQQQLVSTEEKIDMILLQIEQGNEQYFILKKRYDALDIEYAQLYEKFAEAEEGESE